MDSLQIKMVLKKVFAKSHIHFLGVFTSDRIPSLEYIQAHPPCAYVSNIDQHGQRGTHWVAIYHPTSRTVEFFDSFGRDPVDCGFHFSKQLQIFHNLYHIQSDFSQACGHYCIYILYFISQGEQLAHLCTRLASKPCRSRSDDVVTDFTLRLMNTYGIK